MTVQELIDRLKEMPPFLEVCAWDGDADEYLPVKDVIYEDGCTSVDLETERVV